MQLTVIVDNYTFIYKYFYGEPGLSFYIEDDGDKILFDCGYSDLFKSNAEKIGIDLSELTKVVFSHGHDDHTGGLCELVKIIKDDTEIIAHTDT
ncbi:MAG: MBL fold metallo-hydrolase, partial [Methanocorpusculum sp.]|nr:MBL fold metallo-hydrolase [Methanocorpusculum sp.]